MRKRLVRRMRQRRHVLRRFSLDFVDFRRKSLQPRFQLALAPRRPTRSSPERKRTLPLLPPWSPPRPPSETHRRFQSMREGVAVATASAVDVHGSDRRGPDHHKEVQGEVLVLATWFAPRRTAASRGRTSFQLALVLVPPVLTLTPPPTVLEGQPAPTHAATPRHSSQTSALGELHTGYTMLGKQLTGVRFTSAQRAKQHSAH